MKSRDVQHRPLIWMLGTLAGLAAAGLCAALVVAALMGAGVMERSPQRMIALVSAIGVMVMALLLLILEIGARRTADAADLRASEITTLTFPPSPRVRRSAR